MAGPQTQLPRAPAQTLRQHQAWHSLQQDEATLGAALAVDTLWEAELGQLSRDAEAALSALRERHEAELSLKRNEQVRPTICFVGLFSCVRRDRLVRAAIELTTFIVQEPSYAQRATRLLRSPGSVVL
jgi:hypothetical protein